MAERPTLKGYELPKLPPGWEWAKIGNYADDGKTIIPVREVKKD